MSANPVRAQLEINRRPTPRRAINLPLEKLETRYPHVTVISSIPMASSGIEKLVRIDGHATPSRPSGIPKAMNATYASRIIGSFGLRKIRFKLILSEPDFSTE